MAKIVGAKIQENIEYEKEDKTIGRINKVEFRCMVRDLGSDKIGYDVARYSVDIDNLQEVFYLKNPIANVKEFCKTVLNRECLIETRPSVYEGRLSERLVGVTFKE